MKQSILCVDDEKYNLEALERLLRDKYHVFKATSGDEGLALLQEQKVSVIVSDQRMPEMSGTEFLKKSMRIQPETIRILLTGYTDIESVIDAINAGEVYRYVNKPWDPVDFQNIIAQAVEKYTLRKQLQEKNEALQKALDELKVLDESKTNFMYLINHELKTPLTVLDSYLQILGETNLSDDQQLYVNRIESSKKRLHQLVNNVLQLVEAEVGLTKPDFRKSAIETVLDPIFETFKAYLDTKEVSIEQRVQPAQVEMDKKQIQNLVLRLFDNMVKHGDHSESFVIQGEKRSDHYHFQFTNKAQKIPDDKLDQLLKPFTLNENIMNHSEGLGLGLSICQAILKTHGSSLKLRSDDSHFTAEFEIPLSR
ncbi:MAG: hybrid sensor histidine kinase/response regulator [Bdellovibrionaceae bacterium]|nr:hybrid sensor histidine kinase/response regulator [Pseudobdellovibrionaceae bacterium]